MNVGVSVFKTDLGSFQLFQRPSYFSDLAFHEICFYPYKETLFSIMVIQVGFLSLTIKGVLFSICGKAQHLWNQPSVLVSGQLESHYLRQVEMCLLTRSMPSSSHPSGTLRAGAGFQSWVLIHPQKMLSSTLLGKHIYICNFLKRVSSP